MRSSENIGRHAGNVRGAAGTVSELPLSGQLNDAYFYVEGRGTDPAKDRSL